MQVETMFQRGLHHKTQACGGSPSSSEKLISLQVEAFLQLRRLSLRADPLTSALSFSFDFFFTTGSHFGHFWRLPYHYEWTVDVHVTVTCTRPNMAAASASAVEQKLL